MKSLKQLPTKQQRFVLQYLVDLNATQAALRAGYAKNTAEKQASRLLGIVGVQTAISKRQAVMAEKLQVTSERVCQEYARLAFLDFSIFFDESGHFIPIHEMSDDAKAALAGLETSMVRSGNEVDFVKKIKTYDKLKALDALAKHLGFFEKNNDQKQSETSWIGIKCDPRVRDMLDNPDHFIEPVDE